MLIWDDADAFAEAIEPFIAAANALINRAVACGCAAGLDDATLTSAEVFLAAHLFSQSGVGQDAKIKTEERFENYAVKFQTSTAGLDIMGTGYGQTANMLMKGCLLEMSTPRATIEFF